MRICFIALGTFAHIDPYLEYFQKAGHDVQLICLSPGPKRSVQTYDVGLGKTYSPTQGKWKYPLSMLRARRLIKKLKPDIVHAHYATSGGLAALVAGFHPYIVTAHGSDLTTGIKSRIFRPLLTSVFKHADCVNVVSQELCDMTLSLGVSRDKIEIITPGIDVDKFRFIDKPEVINGTNPLRLVCTRRLEPVFDHNTIISVLALLKAKGISFKVTFVGDGSLISRLKQRVSDLGLDRCVEFIPMVSNDRMPDILGRNDVYLSASLWDGTSLSLLEAMATGLFPIVSNIKANSAWLRDGVDGFLHKVGDADDLAKCIQRLVNQPEIVISARQRNRQIVLEKADRYNNMRHLESIYTNLVEQHKTAQYYE
jgi:glycosyltransferase involved in cell wall biosynthesis